MRLRGTSLDVVAGAYVLGTNSLRVRRRFEALMARDAAVRAAHDRWQIQMEGLSGWVPLVRPEPRTLQLLLARVQRGQQARPALQRRAFPRALAATLLGACLALGWVLYQSSQQAVLTAHMEDTQGRGLWQFAAPADASRLAVTVLRPGLVPTDRDLEIWALPADGGGRVVSLGLIPPSHNAVLTMNEAQQRALRSAVRLAITLEPAGGSPSGVATGPILHVAPLNRRS